MRQWKNIFRPKKKKTSSLQTLETINEHANQRIRNNGQKDNMDDKQLIQLIDPSYYKPDKSCVWDTLQALPNIEGLAVSSSSSSPSIPITPIVSHAAVPKPSSSNDNTTTTNNNNNNNNITTTNTNVNINEKKKEEKENEKDNSNNKSLLKNEDSLAFQQYLDQQKLQCELCHQAIERLFKQQLLQNSKEFLSGMHQIREVQFDLRLTESKCSNSRTVLASVDNSLVRECLEVISIYQRRKRTVKTYNMLCEIQMLFTKEKIFNQYLIDTNQSDNFVKAIQVHKELKETLSKYENVACLNKMRIRFRGGNSVITKQLEKKLREVIENAPKYESSSLNVILEAYYQLNEINSLNKVLEINVCEVLEKICAKVIAKQLGFSDTQKEDIHYKKLWKQLKVELFMECFMNICGRVFDILYCYYKIESSIIKFRNLKQIAVEDMQLLRKSLWRKTQVLLGDLLETSQFSSKNKIKMEDLLLALHGAGVFRTIGHSFSGSESTDLENSIRTKCRQYLDHLRTNFYESMKSTFDNEMWTVLPIPRNFGVNSIKELQRSPHLTQSLQSKTSSNTGRATIGRQTNTLPIQKNIEKAKENKEEKQNEEKKNEEEKQNTSEQHVNGHITEKEKEKEKEKEEEQTKNDESSPIQNNNHSDVRNGSVTSPSSELPPPSSQKSQPHVYQQFLSGENIFDQLLKNKQEQEKGMSNKTIFEGGNVGEDDEKLLKPTIGRPNDDGTEPVLTSASLTVAKHVGRCLQVMECLEPVAFESFQALRESFYFYLYHVFVWFGVSVHHFFESSNKYISTLDMLTDSTNMSTMSGGMDSNSGMNISSSGNTSANLPVSNALSTASQKKYPVLTKVINMVNDQLLSRTLAPELDDLIKKKFNAPIRRPRKLPNYAKLLMETSESLDLETDATMQGVAYRFVATETLTFLVQVIETVQTRMYLELSKSQHNQIHEFVETARQVVRELKTYMYRNVPTLLVQPGTDKDSIFYQIKQVKWNRKDLSSEPSPYVARLISMFVQIENVLSSHPTLPKFIHHKLNTEAIIYVQEQMVESYAEAPKCTTEGRALMSLDQSELKKGLQQLKNTEPMPSFDYITNFIQAFYLAEQDLLQWVEEHPEYPQKVHTSFSRVGRAAEAIKSKERNILEQKIVEAHKAGKAKKKTLESKV